MDLFNALDMLIRSVDGGSFASAARQLGVTSAAVSKQVAKLEAHLELQLLVRSTRALTLTEDGRRLIDNVVPGMRQVSEALDAANQRDATVSGVLKVSIAPAFGRQYVLPRIGELLERHPALRMDWTFENRKIDLVAEGFDAAIGGGFDLAGGLVARPLVPLHLIVVASPSYLARRGTPQTPEDLHAHDILTLRSAATGRPRAWTLQGRRTVTIEPPSRFTVSDPEALTMAAVCGHGIALAGMSHARPHLESGALKRILKSWWSDAGAISVYYPHSRLLPVKTRVFIDHVVKSFEVDRLAQRLSASSA